MKFEIAPKSTEIQANWDDARLFCFSLNIDGKTGWRLPSIFELQNIYDAPNEYDFEYLHYWSSTANDFDYLYYWSSTATTWDSTVTAFGFNFMNQLSGQHPKFNRFTVRAVRDLS
jgi:hypothetical protein